MKPTRERVREHADRSKKRGWVRVALWVPEDRARELQKYAAKLRKYHSLFPGNEENDD